MTYDPARTGLIYSNVTTKPGDTVSATAAETDFASCVMLPANTMLVGKTYRIEFMGKYSTPPVVAPTTIAKVKLNGVTVLATPALVNILGAADMGYAGTILITVLDVGVTGSVRAGGILHFATGPISSTTVIVPQVVTIIDTTVEQALRLAAKFSTNVAPNSNTLTSLHVYESRAPRASN